MHDTRQIVTRPTRFNAELLGSETKTLSVGADWASKVPYKQGGFAKAGSAARKGTAAAAAELVGSLPAKHRAGVDFMVDERVAAALAKDPQHLIDGSDAELRKSLADTCREEWPAMPDGARSKYAALASGESVTLRALLPGPVHFPSLFTSPHRSRRLGENACSSCRVAARPLSR